MPSATSKSTITEFYQYDNIPLQVYYDIAHSGDISKVQTKGDYDEANCEVAWDAILQLNGRENGSLKYDKVFKATRHHWKMVSDYTRVKAMLTYLAIKQKDEYIKELHLLGYHIRKETEADYISSIQAADRKSDNLVTKIVTKQKEIDILMQSGEGDKTHSLTELLVDINVELGFIVPTNILLAEYNAYRKHIRAKRAAEKEQLRKARSKR